MCHSNILLPFLIQVVSGVVSFCSLVTESRFKIPLLYKIRSFTETRKTYLMTFVFLSPDYRYFKTFFLDKKRGIFCIRDRTVFILFFTTSPSSPSYGSSSCNSLDVHFKSRTRLPSLLYLYA